MAESANANSSEYPSGSGAGHEASGNNHSGSFDCNICLEISKDTVISMCGHLFCWPCLHRWIETQSPRATCPVCKAAISRDKVIPLYGRDSTDQRDPRDKIPPRPQGQRTESERNVFNGFGNIFNGNIFRPGVDTGVNMSFGIGAFPLGLFATTFNFSGGNNPQNDPNFRETDAYSIQQSELLSKVFLVIAGCCFLWLLLA